MLRSLINNVKERHFRGMRRQTEKLDPQIRDNLREFLEDVPAEVDDAQHLQTQLEEAQARLEKLVEKEAFMEKRIQSYRGQLHKFQVQQQTKGDAMTSEEQESQQKKYETHVATLHQIEASHKIMQRTIEVLEERIEMMEQRHLELRQMTEECQVVYEAAGSMPSTLGQDTTPTDISQQRAESSAVTHQSGSSLDITVNDEIPSTEVDEEIGEIEVPKAGPIP